MPYSNSIGATPKSLTSIVMYLSNQAHKHHEDYDLSPIQLIGARSVQDFMDFAMRAFLKNKNKRRRPPPKNAANWIIVRMPDGTRLQPHEMRAYEVAAREVAGLGGPVVGMHNWHINKYTGAADLNLLTAAFTSSGSLVRDRNTHNIQHLRMCMDQVTDRLNELRKTKGIPLITTMREVQRERAQQRGEVDIVQDLADMPTPPIKAQDLQPALLQLECTISRFNLNKDSISIKLKGRKRAKRFCISSLLHEVRLKSTSQSIHPPARVPQAPAQPQKEEF